MKIAENLILGHSLLPGHVLQSGVDRVLQKGHLPYQKYHLPKIASNINDISQLHYWFSEVLPTPANRTYPYNQ